MEAASPQRRLAAGSADGENPASHPGSGEVAGIASHDHEATLQAGVAAWQGSDIRVRDEDVEVALLKERQRRAAK